MQNQMKRTTAALRHSSPAEAALRPGGATVLGRVLTAKPAFSQGQMYPFQAQGRSLRKRWLLRGKDTSRAGAVSWGWRANPEIHVPGSQKKEGVGNRGHALLDPPLDR